MSSLNPGQAQVRRFDLATGAYMDDCITGEPLDRAYGMFIPGDGTVLIVDFADGQLLRRLTCFCSTTTTLVMAMRFCYFRPAGSYQTLARELARGDGAGRGVGPEIHRALG